MRRIGFQGQAHNTLKNQTKNLTGTQFTASRLGARPTERCAHERFFAPKCDGHPHARRWRERTPSTLRSPPFSVHQCGLDRIKDGWKMADEGAPSTQECVEPVHTLLVHSEQCVRNVTAVHKGQQYQSEYSVSETKERGHERRQTLKTQGECATADVGHPEGTGHTFDGTLSPTHRRNMEGGCRREAQHPRLNRCVGLACREVQPWTWRRTKQQPSIWRRPSSMR